MTDLFSEGNWFWEPGHFPVNFTHWKVSQPQNRSFENFGYLTTETSTAYFWHDHFISSESLRRPCYALCEN